MEDDQGCFLGAIGGMSQMPAGAAGRAGLGSTTTRQRAGDAMWLEVAIPAVPGGLADKKRGSSLLLAL